MKYVNLIINQQNDCSPAMQYLTSYISMDVGLSAHR